MRWGLVWLACLMEAACFGTGVPDISASVGTSDDTNVRGNTAPGMATVDNCGMRNALDTTQTYALINVASQLALTNSVGYGLDANAILLPLDKGPQQTWSFVPFSNGSTRVMNSGMVLGLAGAQAGPSSLWTDGGSPDHVWVLGTVNASACTFTLTNVLTQQFLGIAHSANLAHGRVTSGNFADPNLDTVWQLMAVGKSWPDPMEVSTDAEVSNPSLVKVGSTYLLYSDGAGITVQSSADRSSFHRAGQALPATPDWVNDRYGNKASVVQASVSFVGSQYVLLHSAYISDPRAASIGVAFSPTGQPNTFTQGHFILTSGTASATYPSLFAAPDGSYWLTSGLSEGGIGEYEIDTKRWAVLTQAANPNFLMYRYHGTRVGSSSGGIFQHGPYTYRFETYFETADTQHIVVTRAANYYDTYTDRSDISEFQSGGTIILSTHGRVMSPGHPSVFSDTDGDFLVYDYHDTTDGKQHLGMNLISWESGWPTLMP